MKAGSHSLRGGTEHVVCRFVFVTGSVNLNLMHSCCAKKSRRFVQAPSKSLACNSKLHESLSLSTMDFSTRLFKLPGSERHIFELAMS